MFMLMKLIKPFLLPHTLIFLGMLISFILLMRNKPKATKVILLITMASYYLLSIEPVAYLLVSNLQKSSVHLNLDTEKNVEAIVILAGGVNKMGGVSPFHELGGSSRKRLWHGIELYKDLGEVIPIIYSGGSGDPFDPTPVGPELAKRYAAAMGIPGEMFWTESHSRNTHESGVKVKQILNERYTWIENHKIILVTSAYHMPRSLEVMKGLGMNVVPSPADFVMGKLDLDPRSFVPAMGNFRISYISIHEYFGILTYKILGKF